METETIGWKIVGEQNIHMTAQYYPTGYLLITKGKGILQCWNLVEKIL